MSNRSPHRRIRGASLVAAVAAATLALTACGPGVSTDADADADAAVDTDFASIEPADSITFWSNHPGGSMDIEKDLIAAFEDETGITVEHVTAGANYEEVSERFQTAQASGDVGDVVVLSDATWFTNYLNGSLAPVDPLFEAIEADTGTYQEALYGDYLYEGSHYGAPYARSTPLFYYNAEHYEAAGLDAAPETWEEVASHSQALTDSDTGATPFAFPPQAEYPAWTMSNLVWGHGGAWSDEWDFSSVSSPETVEALQFAQDAVNDDWATVVSGDPATDFSAGAVSQVVASTGSLSGILETADFEIGVGFLPLGPSGDNAVVPTGGAGLSIAAKSTPERQLAAAMFIDFVTNSENTATFSAGTGYLPVRTDVDMSDVYAETPVFEVAVNQLENARSQDFARVFLPGGDLNLSQTLQEILTTDADVEATLADLEATLQDLYDNDMAPLLEQ
ncbi:MAG: ABC transporter substrate-binding protein [Agrococcus casei]|uniref:Glycerol-3-phosphate ABC transporter, periplasmic glycerol-3-phosphate-binding protein (TC 3.A.1.1.3) n=1 Tax=Agrococcus casei LMG 22410 TaxID=1255656 RepID=A0A1R4FA09_9MICO|nr:ABC transporter substrate-binding protein [Agrococcus casei]SJM52748.1 Glycerol-3-phosphate ABC transporter, periplasmic glycerol-3-phosphate-binding protein (TC 3.A.1.1.3) [Agrococcus casei LMG 22410]